MYMSIIFGHGNLHIRHDISTLCAVIYVYAITCLHYDVSHIATCIYGNNRHNNAVCMQCSLVNL